jgi:hypothetical protein
MYAVINPLILLVSPLDAVLYTLTLPHHTKGHNMTTPHENEYLAAIAGLHEQTVSPVFWHGYAQGDRIAYRLHGSSPSSSSAGRVCGDAGPDRVWVNNEQTNRPEVVDVRPWPEGNLLPF